MTDAPDADLLDRHDLERFVSAQEAHGTYDRALAELRDGRKVSHWMWFVFPQIAGLGRSSTARRYAVGTIGEARAYLAHPLLGPRLLECVDALLDLPTHDAEQVFGGVDAMKARSSLTLFAQADPSEPRFARALETYFDGALDRATLDLL
ncbi:DUF1810 domain-containing protein [Frigoribacterium faeni]|uniref:Uncharacterized protein (DUF1810 family) n=1 Tax=Frigoribacterium faeni TaxID=145483 RepID=A0A7W3PJL9_9MICO|nr:DUF1810 domain-containing protein [Frigoribacterium faeni]MBA8814605.1 uncharacterized protein (DUF1810 family) [Frigoribacterium faeni]BFF15516.1 DUF1810 domain-containing protein [Microbacterium flavescens]GEK83499.1 hypothetical protein FFA01_18080 [Frigoribacterium faeni]